MTTIQTAAETLIRLTSRESTLTPLVFAGFYGKQISTSSAAMVGVTEKGPINTPVLVTSWEQFINWYGSYINEGYLAYAARGLFRHVNRIAHLTDPTDRNTLTAV